MNGEEGLLGRIEFYLHSFEFCRDFVDSLSNLDDFLSLTFCIFLSFKSCFILYCDMFLNYI